MKLHSNYKYISNTKQNYYFQQYGVGGKCVTSVTMEIAPPVSTTQLCVIFGIVWT
jgi:hypothetical protein